MSCCRYDEALLLFFCAQGYLTENGVVDLARVQLVLTELGEMEDAIFKQRREDEVSYTRQTTRFTRFASARHSSALVILQGQICVSVLKLDFRRRDKERKKRQKMVTKSPQRSEIILVCDHCSWFVADG